MSHIKIKFKIKKIKYIDLFCGLGAFHEAFNRNNQSNKNV